MPSTNLIEERLKKYRIANKKNKDINCITNDLYDRALSKYKIFTDKQINGPLYGKLFAVKDNLNIKDYPTTCASNILKNHNSDACSHTTTLLRLN